MALVGDNGLYMSAPVVGIRHVAREAEQQWKPRLATNKRPE